MNGHVSPERTSITDLPRRENFISHVGASFTVYDGSGNIYEVTLGSVTDLTRAAGHEQFALLFHGRDEFFLPQGMYGFGSDTAGMFDLFIVPVSRDAGGYTYEAVFNRLTGHQ